MAVAQNDAFEAEEPVVEAIRSGDRFAFGELMGRHHGWVRGVIFGVLGERDAIDDVSQQVWTSVWQRIGELRETKRWRPWLYRLARNAAIDHGRDVTRRRIKAQALAADPPGAPSRLDPDGSAVGREEHQTVMAAIGALPALYREPFVLRHLSGWSYGRIAEVMSMPVDSVETRLVRARRLLRESLAGKLR